MGDSLPDRRTVKAEVVISPNFVYSFPVPTSVDELGEKRSSYFVGRARIRSFISSIGERIVDLFSCCKISLVIQPMGQRVIDGGLT